MANKSSNLQPIPLTFPLSPLSLGCCPMTRPQSSLINTAQLAATAVFTLLQRRFRSALVSVCTEANVPRPGIMSTLTNQEKRDSDGVSVAEAFSVYTCWGEKDNRSTVVIGGVWGRKLLTAQR